MIGIYKITSPTGKVYIGQSINIERRFMTYNRSKFIEQPRLYNSFFKHGVINHKFEIICECSIYELNEKERYYQDLYYVLGNKGLNCVLTKSFGRHVVVSQETRLKISIASKGRKHSEETKLKMSKIKTGKGHSKETKLKLSLINIGNSNSKETKIKMSNSKKNITPYWCQKIILDTSIGIFYIGILEASIAYDIKRGTLKAMLCGQNKNKTNLIYA